MIAHSGLRNGIRFLASKQRYQLRWGPLLPLGFISIFFYQPLFRILSESFGAKSFGYLTSASTYSVLWFTLWQALLSTVISLCLAIPSAYLLYRVRVRGSRIISSLIAVPFILPTIVVAIAVKSIWRDGGITALIFANVLMNFGFATRLIGTGWARLDHAVEEAAALDGAGKIRTFFAISWYGLAESLRSTGLLIFLYCSANFGLMLVIGGGRMHSLETGIYLATTQLLDLHLAGTYVFLQLLVTLSALFMTKRTRGFMAFTNLSTNRGTLSIREWPVVVFVGATILVMLVIPMARIFYQALQTTIGFGLQNYRNLITHGSHETLSITVNDALHNSARNAAVSMAIALPLGLYLTTNRTRLLLLLFRIPVGISTLILGLGYLITFTSGGFPLRSSWLVTPIAQSIALIPLVIQIVSPHQEAIGPDLRDIGRVDGLTAFEYSRYVELPLLRQPIAIAVGYIALISLGEFGAANLLSYGDQATLPTILYQLVSRPGAINFGMALAASTLLILVSVLITLCVELGSYSKSPE